MEDTSATAIAAVLDQVGARLKRIRTQRGMTLTGVAEATRVPVDDLVGAPPEGDPRLRLKPGRVKGRTVIPLTRQAGGMQAWKIVIPTGNATPEPRAHEGHEWIYVLSGADEARSGRPGLGARAG